MPPGVQLPAGQSHLETVVALLIILIESTPKLTAHVTPTAQSLSGGLCQSGAGARTSGNSPVTSTRVASDKTNWHQAGVDCVVPPAGKRFFLLFVSSQSTHHRRAMLGWSRDQIIAYGSWNSNLNSAFPRVLQYAEEDQSVI